MNAASDTLAAARELKAAGFGQEHAEAVAGVMLVTVSAGERRTMLAMVGVGGLAVAAVKLP